jgi:hypothetical protein
MKNKIQAKQKEKVRSKAKDMIVSKHWARRNSRRL